MQTVVSSLLWFSAVGCGLMAGVYFAFSTFIMRSFASIEAVHGISAMGSINTTILRSPFMPLFFGTTAASAAVAVLALFRWNEPGAAVMLAGGLIYFVGMFVCTVVLNVPLNNELDRINASSAEAAAVWARYLRDWTFWNHVRTVASTLATALFVAALVSRGNL